MSEQAPIKKIGLNVLISPEMAQAYLDAQDAAQRWEAMSPAEQEAERRARKEARAREQTAVVGLHGLACAELVGKLREVAELHGAEDALYPHCQGCDVDGYEGEQPEWPCRTYTLVTGVTRAQVDEVRKAVRATG